MADDYPIPPDLSGGKKTAFVVEGRRKIHTVWEDLGGIEMAEEYDLSNDELLIRKFKKPTPIGGEGVWVYEIGEPPINPRGDKEIMESVNAVCYSLYYQYNLMIITILLALILSM